MGILISFNNTTVYSYIILTSIHVHVRTIMSGSILACISLDTGSSPDGAVLFVLSMYIGLNQ